MSLLIHPVQYSETITLGRLVIQHLLMNPKVIVREKEQFCIDVGGNSLREHLRLHGVTCGSLGLGLIAHYLLVNKPMPKRRWEFYQIKKLLLDNKYIDAEQCRDLWKAGNSKPPQRSWKEFYIKYPNINHRSAIAWGSIAAKGYFRFSEWWPLDIM